MPDRGASATGNALQGPAATIEFSLVRGGLVHRQWCRMRLSTAELELEPRRIALIVLVAWLPLLLLSMAEGNVFGGAALPFLRDIENHVRLLVALPLLLWAEGVVHRRLRRIVGQFHERDLIPASARSRFDAAVASAARLRDSHAAEAVMISLIYGSSALLIYGSGGMTVFRSQVIINVEAWYGVWSGGELHASYAGKWLLWVSLPLFQFLLLRWYYRLLIWVRLMWQVSRIRLQLVPVHPDRCGGLGFLGDVGPAFGPLLMAQSALLAGVAANRIFLEGAHLLHFKAEMALCVVAALVLALGPLMMYAPRLEAAARAGRLDYGMLAQRYALEFERKWLRGGAPGEALLGSADIQSLADIGASLDIVNSMRWVPFPPRAVVAVAVMALVPFVPLVLTMVPLQRLLEQLLKVLF